MLAIVQHQQPHPAVQRSGHTVGHRFAGLLGDAQHRRHCIRHRTRISHSGQLEKPDAVRELIDGRQWIVL